MNVYSKTMYINYTCISMSFVNYVIKSFHHSLTRHQIKKKTTKHHIYILVEAIKEKKGENLIIKESTD